MSQTNLMLTDMANGGVALGRDESDRIIFVPLALPGELVQVEILEQRKHFAKARLLSVLSPSLHRVEPQCPHFGPCGGCHFQHIEYRAQLEYKRSVIVDQLARIGGISRAPVEPVYPNPQPLAYAVEVILQVTDDGRPGYWSPTLQQVMAIETCVILSEPLLQLLQDIDLQFPGLRRLVLRVGEDSSRLAAVEVSGDEPPELEADFPISVAMLLPDGTAANLLGENYLVQAIKGRHFRFSAGAHLYPSPIATEMMIDAILDMLALKGGEQVVELYSGAGAITAFLAGEAAEVITIEANPDAVQDMVVNLDHLDNVSLYEGLVEEILPHLALQPDVIVVDPPDGGLPLTVVDEIKRFEPGRLVYVSSDVATMARDSRRLADKGYELVRVQPVDMVPQNYQVLTVSLWKPIDR